ncbi:insulinase family protein [Streptomyces anandii]|uniref:insulinase family protein n=1 Tax=Streptomyces anandii TaxID=285454 RepID=UPI003702B079
MADAAPSAELLRIRLPNGLRVLLAPTPGVPRIAVCVTYAVGFRSERPGQEGLAHLFEHLMFRGSESLPNGRFYDHVHRLAAHANGTTHQDYTDYYQVVPASALEAALFSEADRMRAPYFTESELSQQVDGVASEINQRTLDRPLGDLPWPLLPQVLYRAHHNAHDGLGDIGQLRQTTVDDCAEFFHTHYAPGNAVLTVAGGFSPQHALALIERHFGDIPGRPAPARPQLDEASAGADRWLHCDEPKLPSPVVAVGYRLTGPDRDLDGYLARMIMARMLSTASLHPAPGAAMRLSASCGLFGPMDARTPDALVLVGMLPSGVTPEQFPAALRAALVRYAEGGIDIDKWQTAVRDLVVDHRRAHGDLQTRCRALGRLESLFDRAHLLDEIPDRWASVRQGDLEAAASALALARQGVVVMEPAEIRHRPRPAAARSRKAAGSVPHPSAHQLGHTEQGPRSSPQIAPPSDAVFSSTHMETLPNGLRLILVEDQRSASIAEVRLRIPLGAAALTAPAAVDRRLQTTAAPEKWNRRNWRGWTAHVSPDGQWLNAAAHLTVESLTAALETLLSWATNLTPDDLDPESQESFIPPDSHEWLLAQTLARHALHQTGTSGHLMPGLAGGCLALTVPSPTATVLDAVGPILRSPAADSPPPGQQHTEVVWDTNRLIHVARSRQGPASVLLCSPERREPTGEPARYLATAIFGGYHRSRLVAAVSRQSLGIMELLAGRDTFLGQRRAWVRARVPQAEADWLLAVVRSEAARLVRQPPSALEIQRAAEFCAAQMTAVFDSPASLADALARLGAAGWTPADLAQFPRRLWQTTAEEVEQAALELFARGLRGGVVLAGI